MKSKRNSLMAKFLNTIILSFLVIGFLGTPNAVADGSLPPDVLDLEQALIIALEENPTVRAAAERIESAEFRQQSARAEMRPSIATSYSYTGLADDPFIRIGGMPPTQIAASDQFHWDLTIVQPIFSGFALSTQYEMAKLGVEIKEVEEQESRQYVIKGVTSAYYGLLLTEKLLSVAEEAVQLLESHQRDSQLFYDRGVIRLNELLRVRVALAAAVQRRETVAAAEKMAVSDLNRWLAFEIGRETRVQDVTTIPGEHFELEAMIRLGLENRPLLRSLHLTLKNLQKVVPLEKSALFPKIALVGGYERVGHDILASENDFANDHNAFISISAKWTLFDGFKTRSKMARAQADTRAFRHDLRSAEDGVRLEIKSAFLDLQVAERNIETADASLGQAEESLRVTKLGFMQRAATSTEVLDTRTDLTRAQTNYFVALYGYLDALAELERAVGVPLVPGGSPPTSADG